ncbi:MAG TPA: Mrp/NBP35 family ATP-binding protein [Chthoniobacteraceae bacterium]|nr:Mrp/NBP35 family ATP-binding protein [Chthoniobacteraceae bacterium]
MPEITEQQVRERLSTVKYPGFSRDIVSFGIIKGIRVEGADVTVQMAIATADANVPRSIKQEGEAALAAIPGIGNYRINIDIQAPAQQPAGMGATAIPGIKHIIAVASGKGGVGKSTVAANLAVAPRQTGATVGLCDCDLYGPSIGLMFNVRERPMVTEENRIIPIERCDLKLMSMSFLLDDDSPAILRGPMVTKYTQQFLRWVEWGELDFLVLDLPPGTGDIQLTIVQTVALGGAVIVTTPQDIALLDAKKGLNAFEKVQVPVLGIIENMATHVCSNCGHEEHVFGEGGGARMAEQYDVPLLGSLPLDIRIREQADGGNPTVAAMPDSDLALRYRDIARNTAARLSLQAERDMTGVPNIRVVDD